MKPIFPFGAQQEDCAQPLAKNGPAVGDSRGRRRLNGKLARLSPYSQEILKALALIGNASSLTTLAIVRNESVDAIGPALLEAIGSGLIAKWGGFYWFADAAALDAVYSGISEPEREAGLSRIGTLLHSMVSAEAANWLENIRLYNPDRDSMDRDPNMDIIHANRLRITGQLTASIAHEVSQPVAASIINAQSALRWLSAEPPNLDETRGALKNVVANGKRAGEILSRIRSLIKKKAPHADAVDINDAVREVVEFSAAETDRMNIRVATDFTAGAPIVLGDRVELQQVVLNMIVNAIEAMRPTRKQDRSLLVCTSRNAMDEILISVGDSGPGVHPDQLEQVFRPFHTSKPGGLGIGLAVCRSIIEAHQGRMWAETNKPRGVVFKVGLKADPSTSNRSVQLDRGARPSRQRARKNVEECA